MLSTVIRVPATTGFPCITAGSDVIDAFMIRPVHHPLDYLERGLLLEEGDRGEADLVVVHAVLSGPPASGRSFLLIRIVSSTGAPMVQYL